MLKILFCYLFLNIIYFEFKAWILSTAFRKINPHWKPGTLFYEARKIIGAFNQIIHYRDYLPTQLGDYSL